MTDNQMGYEYYKESCIKHHLEPVNVHYFILNISEQQLNFFTVHAIKNRGQYEVAI